MPSLSRRRLRLACNILAFDEPQDAVLNRPVKLWASNDLAVEVGVFAGTPGAATLIDSVANWSSLTLSLLTPGANNSAPDPATAAVRLTKTVSSFAVPSYADWQAATAQHATITATGDETALPAGKYWLVLSLQTTDSPARTITLLAGLIDIAEDGYNSAGTAPTVNNSAYTKAESDARYLTELPETISARLQVLSGTDAALATETLLLGEIAAPTDAPWLRKGDGVTVGGAIVGPAIQSQSVIPVRASGTPAQNGAALQAATLLAGTMSPFGSPASASNVVTLLLSPGQYDVTATPPGSTDFIAFVGATSAREVVIYRTDNGPIFSSGARHRSYKNLTLINAGGAMPTALGGADSLVTFQSTSGKVQTMEDCVLSSGSGAAIVTGSNTTGISAFIRRCEFVGACSIYSLLTGGVSRTPLRIESCALGSLQAVANGLFRDVVITSSTITGSVSNAPMRDALIRGTRIESAGTNQTCITLAGSGVRVYDCDLIATGTGLCVDAATAQTAAISHCRLNLASPFGANVTNSLGTLAASFNVASTSVT